jgi:hypothetical protein
MNLLDLWRKFMKWGLIITPPILVVSFITLPLIDAARPWSVAESKLDSHGWGGLAICLGMSSYSSRTGDQETTEKQRSYLLVTKGELATITETQENGEKTVSIDSNKWGFWIILILFLTLVWVTIRISIPRFASRIQPSRTTRWR